MSRFIVPAFFEVVANTQHEADTQVAAAHDMICAVVGAPLLLDEGLPTMKVPVDTMEIHSVLNLLRIRPIDGV